MTTSPVSEYTVRPTDAGAHEFIVELSLAGPIAEGQLLSLPAWIRGSYLVRDFSRNVIEVSVESNGQVMRAGKIDKSTWQIASSDGPVVIRYTVYANDLSVRGAHFDTTHAYFNGPAVFMKVHGREDQPCRVHLAAPDHPAAGDWQVATSLMPENASESGFGTYGAESYEDLIDHPVEMGTFVRVAFDVLDVPHAIAVTGRQHGDLDRLRRDVAVICETHARMFGLPAPIDRYLFLLTALGEGYGGLEHRYSSSLVCKRTYLPRPGDDEVSEDYRRLLGLFSHEYFHLWNIKRIQPQHFAASDLADEAYTRLLWVFEGITSYYDDLALVRSGLIDAKSYLQLVARTITRVLRTPGRLRQTVEESSFDTWIKFYKRDENTPNAVVSYYDKGSLVALTLDLTIRRDTGNEKSLDDVMRAMWREHADAGVEEGGFERLAETVTGVSLGEFFDYALRSTEDLPLAGLLDYVGVELKQRPAIGPKDHGGSLKPNAVKDRPSLGVKAIADAGNVRLKHVFRGGPAESAGLSADDYLVALDGIRITPKNFNSMLRDLSLGSEVEITAFRRDELMSFKVTLTEAPSDTCDLVLSENPGADILENRSAWLAGEQD